MLTDGIAKAYQDGKVHFDSRNSVKAVLTTESKGREASPNLYETTGDAFLSDHTIGEEVFGPLGVVVRVKSVDDMVHLAKGLEGQLTATLHMDRDDAADARKLLPVLERKAGRVLANGFPTGVEVVDSMVHGAPTPPALTSAQPVLEPCPSAASCGPSAIKIFLWKCCLLTSRKKRCGSNPSMTLTRTPSALVNVLCSRRIAKFLS